MRGSSKVAHGDTLPLVYDDAADFMAVKPTTPSSSNHLPAASASRNSRLLKWILAILIVLLITTTTVLLVTLLPLLSEDSVSDATVDTIDIYILSPDSQETVSSSSSSSSSSSAPPAEDIFISATVNIPSVSDMHSVDVQHMECDFSAYGNQVFASASVTPIGRLGSENRQASINVTISASDYNVLGQLRAFAINPENGDREMENPRMKVSCSFQADVDVFNMFTIGPVTSSFNFAMSDILSQPIENDEGLPFNVHISGLESSSSEPTTLTLGTLADDVNELVRNANLHLPPTAFLLWTATPLVEGVHSQQSIFDAVAPGPIPMCEQGQDAILVGFQDSVVPLITNGRVENNLHLDVISKHTQYDASADPNQELAQAARDETGGAETGHGLLSLLALHFTSLVIEPRSTTNFRPASQHDSMLTFLLSHFQMVHEFSQTMSSSSPEATLAPFALPSSSSSSSSSSASLSQSSGGRNRRASSDRPQIGDAKWDTTVIQFEAVVFDSLDSTAHGGFSGLFSVSEGKAQFSGDTHVGVDATITFQSTVQLDASMDVRVDDSEDSANVQLDVDSDAAPEIGFDMEADIAIVTHSDKDDFLFTIDHIIVFKDNGDEVEGTMTLEYIEQDSSIELTNDLTSEREFTTASQHLELTFTIDDDGAGTTDGITIDVTTLECIIDGDAFFDLVSWDDFTIAFANEGQSAPDFDFVMDATMTGDLFGGSTDLDAGLLFDNDGDTTDVDISFLAAGATDIDMAFTFIATTSDDADYEIFEIDFEDFGLSHNSDPVFTMTGTPRFTVKTLKEDPSDDSLPSLDMDVFMAMEGSAITDPELRFTVSIVVSDEAGDIEMSMQGDTTNEMVLVSFDTTSSSNAVYDITDIDVSDAKWVIAGDVFMGIKDWHKMRIKTLREGADGSDFILDMSMDMEGTMLFSDEAPILLYLDFDEGDIDMEMELGILSMEWAHTIDTSENALYDITEIDVSRAGLYKRGSPEIRVKKWRGLTVVTKREDYGGDDAYDFGMQIDVQVDGAMVPNGPSDVLMNMAFDEGDIFLEAHVVDSDGVDTELAWEHTLSDTDNKNFDIIDINIKRAGVWRDDSPLIAVKVFQTFRIEVAKEDADVDVDFRIILLTSVEGSDVPGGIADVDMSMIVGGDGIDGALLIASIETLIEGALAVNFGGDDDDNGDNDDDNDDTVFGISALLRRAIIAESRDLWSMGMDMSASTYKLGVLEHPCTSVNFTRMFFTHDGTSISLLAPHNSVVSCDLDDGTVTVFDMLFDMVLPTLNKAGRVAVDWRIDDSVGDTNGDDVSFDLSFTHRSVSDLRDTPEDVCDTVTDESLVGTAVPQASELVCASLLSSGSEFLDESTENFFQTHFGVMTDDFEMSFDVSGIFHFIESPDFSLSRADTQEATSVKFVFDMDFEAWTTEEDFGASSSEYKARYDLWKELYDAGLLIVLGQVVSNGAKPGSVQWSASIQHSGESDNVDIIADAVSAGVNFETLGQGRVQGSVSSSSSSSDAAIIIGGAAGGAAGVVLIAVVAVLLVKKKKKSNSNKGSSNSDATSSVGKSSFMRGASVAAMEMQTGSQSSGIGVVADNSGKVTPMTEEPHYDNEVDQAFANNKPTYDMAKSDLDRADSPAPEYETVER